MNVDFVPYQEALELKALGFDEPCVAFYEQSGRLSIGFNWLNEGGKNSNLQECTAPLYQQAFRWFREKYDLQYTITWNKNYPKTPYGWEVRKSWRDEPIRPYGISGMSATHEEAELACLRKLIEIIKSQKE